MVSGVDTDFSLRVWSSQAQLGSALRSEDDFVGCGAGASVVGHPARAEGVTGLRPAYIAVAGHDQLRDNGARYAELLAVAGVPVEVQCHRLVHGYLGYAGIVPAATDAVDRGLAALRAGLA